MQFAVPASWEVLTERATDSLTQYAYFIRKPGIDTSADVSTNVIVNVRRASPSSPFRAATDRWLARLLDSTTIVLHDTLTGGTQRAVFWRGKDGPWTYIGFDDFARIGDRLIHVRIAEPLGGAAPAAWSRRFERETGAVLRSIMLDGKRAFPAPIGYPTVVSQPPSRRRHNVR